MVQTHKKSNWVKRSLRRLFGSPFQELPPEFGDPVLPELRVFEAEVEEVQHHIYRVQGGLPSAQPADHTNQGKTLVTMLCQNKSEGRKDV